MSIASRLAKCTRLRATCAGQAMLTQRSTASPSSRSAMLPQEGQTLEIR